jgi:hypothetical protein
MRTITSVIFTVTLGMSMTPIYPYASALSTVIDPHVEAILKNVLAHSINYLEYI